MNSKQHSKGTQQLKKNLGLSTAMATVVGCVIGSGVFLKPQAIYTATGGAPGLGMLAWIITGLICIAAAMTFAEVAIMIPKTGGMVVYLEEAFGKRVGFLAGWMQTVLFYPAMIAALSVAFGQQAALFFGDAMIVPIAIICVFIILVLNVLGQLLIAVLFAFEGWTTVGAIAGEMKNPGKDLPLAIVGGVTIIMAIYLVMNLAYLWVMPADQMMDIAVPASAVAIAIFGDVGGKIISVGIMISVLGSANGFLLSGSRVTYHLATENLLPGSRWLSKLNSAQVPHFALLVLAFLGAIYAISGQFNMLTNLAVFSSWIFYTLTFMAVMRLRKTQPDFPRTYRCPLYPVIPLIAIISGIYVVANQLFLSGMTTTLISFGSVILTLIGLPVYAIKSKEKARLAESESVHAVSTQGAHNRKTAKEG